MATAEDNRDKRRGGLGHDGGPDDLEERGHVEPDEGGHGGYDGVERERDYLGDGHGRRHDVRRRRAVGGGRRVDDACRRRRHAARVHAQKNYPPLGVFGFVPLAHASGTKHFICAGPRHASQTKTVSIGVRAVLVEKSRRNDSRFFSLSIFGSSPPAKRFENHFASAPVKHVYPEQQGTVAPRGRVRYQGDGHRAQVTQLKGCAVGISVYAGNDANDYSMFQVSVLWPVTLEMCEFEPGQG